MNRRLTLLLIIFILAASWLTIIEPVQSSITKPSVPEFTLKLVDSSYDVPTAYSTDPYTGENLTHAGYHVESMSIELTIKNQPFVPYNDASSGWNIEFYYNIRIKGHYSEDWVELYRSSEGYFVTQSDSQYTTVSYALGENTDPVLGTKMIEFTSGAQVDFQVEAMIGYISRDYNPNATGELDMYPWRFTGETSGWSETQTLTINAPASPSTQNTSPAQNSTAPSDRSGSQNAASSDLDWALSATLALLGFIGVLLVVVAVYLCRR